MIQLPIFAQARFSAFFAIARSAVCLSRILLLVIAVEVITMPFTQGLWSWDRFLHGGQDFELGLLLIVTCLCFVLLCVQQNKSGFGWLSAIRALLLKAHRRWTQSITLRPTSLRHRTRIPWRSSPAEFNPPLLI